MSVRDLPAGGGRAEVTDSLQVARELLRRADGTLAPSLVVGRPPAFLLPSDRSVAAAMCRSHNGLRPRRRRLERAAAAAVVRAGLGRAVGRPLDDAPGPRDLAPPGALLDELRDRLGTDLRVGVGLGTLDGYWKPVLQLFDPAGRAVGFAKVGWTGLTSALVDNEADVLELLDGGRGGVRCPRPLHRFTCGSLTVLVTEPLPDDTRRLPDDRLPGPPEDLVEPDPEPAALGDLAWWGQLRAWADATTLDARLGTVEERLGDHRLATGLQHGDWVPWNLGRRPDGRLVAWDWEYGRTHAPLGVDLVHGRYQAARLLDGLDADAAFRTAHEDAPVPLAVLHAAMVAARRCWVRARGVQAGDPGDELGAARRALDRLLAGGVGPA